MERINCILPECYADTNLINLLTGKNCNHQKGCPNVCKTMANKFNNEFAVGVIDKDKHEPKAMGDYRLIAGNDYLLVHKHIKLHHYIIQIVPAVEVFILNAVDELKIDVTAFGFSAKLDDFKKKTKTIDSKFDIELTNLCKAVLNANNINTLKCILEYLIKYKYYVNETELVNLLKQ